MKCPNCKTELEVTGQERLETLSEHVSNPNGTPSLKNLWQCVNTDCKCFRAFGWNDDGEFYSGDYYSRVREVFRRDESMSAIGSFSRKLDVEVSKMGLPKRKYLHPAWMLWFFQPFIEWHGIADEDGNILKRWFTIEILRKDKSGYDGYCIHASYCWDTWAYLWEKFKNEYQNQNYKAAFKPSLNRSWPYRWFETFLKIRYFSRHQFTGINKK